MEVDSDGDILQLERCIVGLWSERQITVLGTTPKDTSLRELYRLRTRDDLTLGLVWLIEGEGDLIGSYDAYRDVGFL